MNEKKQKMQFHIIKSDPVDDHQGYGKGTLSLANLSPVIIDVNAGKAMIDAGALHARSQLEKGIKFVPVKDEVPNGKPYWLVWVTIDGNAESPYYAGVTACEMTVDSDTHRGYKSMPEHVNRMDKSLKRKIIVEHMDAKSKQILTNFLRSHNEELWDHSSDDLKQGLSS